MPDIGRLVEPATTQHSILTRLQLDDTGMGAGTIRRWLVAGDSSPVTRRR